GERADAADIGGPLGDADDAARVEQVEEMARLQRLVISRQGDAALDQPAALRFGIAEMLEQLAGVRRLEIVDRVFPLGPLEDLPIGDLAVAGRAVEVEVEDALDP